ncbi:hypothetical protein P168DRAFT_286266 [Aspergillus campestris IBT 28561]|uniref:Uncharacterized protein n=1 Tax=Aspergillus campestris (strain IBT 28561) TaxID=1392248 RepID=A0A2I1DDZ3_ASPC2|nr:uncharacterized protein P168DRAFT_286266 [Aspergillus campestris IBT 28561]PKY08107.1 hypothetical protein P168DRAFT_286266 [Aspergillus campestris IBT 28561]
MVQSRLYKIIVFIVWLSPRSSQRDPRAVFHKPNSNTLGKKKMNDRSCLMICTGESRIPQQKRLNQTIPNPPANPHSLSDAAQLRAMA